MKRVILGTAGHIDHGKTTLVKALTGTDTDRLPEEKARGITIDLGFAHLRIGELDIGIVDVPGHEGLIRNMLAGATGFDAVLLVIAADEGVMPQTREHVAIARLLGVEQLMVALTKTDTVESDWLDLVRSDVETFIAAEFGAAPIIAVSAVTGAGLEELRQIAAGRLAVARQKQDEDFFRLPIDRVFTVHGTGTVVTGTVWHGRAARHDTLQLLPAGQPVRVRGVQTHGAEVDSAGAGERAAYALTGIDRADLSRGDVLVAGSACLAARTVTARVQLLAGVALKARQRVRVHLGTAEVLGRVVQLADDWMQLRLEAPLVARACDRFVLRSYSPVITIGGGQVAELDRTRKRATDAELALLQTILEAEPADRMRAAVALAADQGVNEAMLPAVARVTPVDVRAFAGNLPDDVVHFENRYYSRPLIESTIANLEKAVRAHHTRQPLEKGIERALLLSRSRSTLAGPALEFAIAHGRLVSRGSVVTSPGFEAGFPAALQALRSALLEQLRMTGLMPPSVPELTASHRSKDVRAVLRLMEVHGEVTAIGPDLYIERQTLAAALERVRQLGHVALPAGEFKTALPVSRKYLIPLLEYMDRSGVTKREGDLRWVLPMEQPETA